MTDWLLAQGHWAFIVLAYGLFVVALLLDGLLPWAGERRLRRELLALQRRTRSGESS